MQEKSLLRLKLLKVGLMLSLRTVGQLTSDTGKLGEPQRRALTALVENEFWIKKGEGSVSIDSDIKEAWALVANYRVLAMKGRDVKKSLMHAAIIAVAYTPITELSDTSRYLSERENRLLFSELMYEAYILSEVFSSPESEQALKDKGFLEKDAMNNEVLKSAGRLFVEKISAMTQAGGVSKIVDKQTLEEMKSIIESSVVLAKETYESILNMKKSGAV